MSTHEIDEARLAREAGERAADASVWARCASERALEARRKSDRAAGKQAVRDAAAASKLLAVRFAGSRAEFRLTAARPEVGDALRRGKDEWLVVSVENDARGNGGTVVTLAPPTPRV